MKKILTLLILLVTNVAYADCATPTGPEGSLRYISGEYVYCDGTNWIGWGENSIAAGPNQSIQFNNSSALAGVSSFVFDSANVRLGIGTASPSYKIDVITSGSYPRLNLETTGPSDGGSIRLANSGSAWFIQNDAGGLQFFNGTERMRILTGGNVGINDTSADAQLDVVASSSSTIGQIIQGAASQTANLAEWQNSAGTAIVSIDASGRMNVNGNAGAGTTPVLTLTRNGGYTTPYLSGGGVFSLFSTGADMMVGTSADSPWFQTAASVTNINSTALNGKNTTLTAASASGIPLIVKGATSQSANLQEWQNSAGTQLSFVSPSGKLNLLTSGTGVQNLMNLYGDAGSGSSNVVGFEIRNTNATSNKVSFYLGGGTPGSDYTRAWGVGTDIAGSGAQSLYFFNGNTSTSPFFLTGESSIFSGSLIPTSNSARVQVQTTAAATKGLTILAHASQTANLQEWQDSTGTALAFVHASGDISVPDEAYGAGWNGSVEVPTKNAVYDKIETLTPGGASAGGNNETIQFNNSSAFAGASTFVYKSASGYVGLGTATPAATLDINAASSGAIGEIIRGAAAQTANLFEFQSANGSILANISSAGNYIVKDDNYVGFDGSTAARMIFDNLTIDTVNFASANVSMGTNPTQANRLIVEDTRTTTSSTRAAGRIVNNPAFNLTILGATSSVLDLVQTATGSTSSTAGTGNSRGVNISMNETITQGSTGGWISSGLYMDATGNYTVNAGHLQQAGYNVNVSAGTSTVGASGTYTQYGFTGAVTSNLGTTGVTSKRGIQISVTGTADIGYGLYFNNLQDTTTIYGIYMGATGTGVKHLLANDNQKTYFGTGEDVAMYFTGTDFVFDPEVATGSFVFNSSGADTNFNVEGDTDASLFFVDAGTDRVGIGTSSPATKLDVNGAMTAVGSPGLTIGNGSTSSGSIKLLEDTDNGTNFVNLNAPSALAANATFVFPSSGGSSGQTLITDGTGITSWSGVSKEFCWAGSDFDTTTLVADTAVVNEYPPMPSTFNVTSVYAYVRTAPSATLTIDINEVTTSILSTKLTIDSGEFSGGSANTPGTAATPAVISDATIAANAQITADIDSTTGGAGLMVCIQGYF